MSDEFANAKEAGGATNTWKPDERSTIFGTYLHSKSDQGPNHSMVYVIQEDDQEVATSVWGSTVLDSRFEEIPTRSRVKIEFIGEVEGKGPKPYKNFKVVFVEPTDAVAEVFPNSEEVKTA